MDTPLLKPVHWMGSSKRDLKAFPPEVQDEVRRALLDAQFGGMPRNAKPLKGYVGAGVLEIVEDHDRSTVYTVHLPDAVYVLHAFQKKSTRGTKTPIHELELIRERYRAAESHYRPHGGKQ